MPAAVGRGDLDLRVGQRRNVEELRYTLAPFDFHEKDASPACRQGQRQRGRDRRLARPALTGDEMQSGPGQPVGPGDFAAVAR